MSTGSRGEASSERTSALLPALMLARIDGKSPVEYLDAAAADAVRAFARAQLEGPAAALGEIADRWRVA